LIKKISDKDKQDWDNFLNNKKLPPNKDYIKKKNIRDKKTIEISDKDKQDWENFLKKKEKIPNKDFTNKKNTRYKKIKKIDLHGYTIEEANKAIEQFIQKSFHENVTKIIVITGKGLRSKNVENPYLSKDLSILKYSVPEFIENNKNLTKVIIETTDAKIEDGGSGAFYIYLKNKNKFKE
jgi:DNA-nicking Smr family endonuclease